MNWDNYFMSIAYLASLRSKDKRTKVGACIVDDNNRIISTGYNGMPNGCNDDDMPWDLGEELENKHLYVVHAELNAILSSKVDLKGFKLYTTLFPCNECAKAIVQSGIKEVIYLSDKYHNHITSKSSKVILNKSNTKYRKLNTELNVNIDLKCEV